MKNNNLKGTLFIVATPVGNLEDITFRAVKILKEVDIILAEDTRHSKKLLLHYDIGTRLVSCHEHNEANKTPGILNNLKKGLDIALISDAGTPTISDPGYKLVTYAAKEGINIVPVPGCCASIAAISAAGLPTDSFLFLGFLPRKKAKQRHSLEVVKNQTATLIFYESPKRVKSLISNIIFILGDRQACLAREITKIHEEFIRDKLSVILNKLEGKNNIKGECSLIVQGCLKEKKIELEKLEEIVKKRLLINDSGTSYLAGQISKEFNIPKSRIYDMILKIQGR